MRRGRGDLLIINTGYKGQALHSRFVIPDLIGNLDNGFFVILDPRVREDDN